LKKLRILLAIVTTLTVLIAGNGSASAQTGQIVFHGVDSVSLTNAHTVRVCDNERDGHYVWVELYAPGFPPAREADGGDPGCDTETFSINYDKVRLCEENKGCTAFHDIIV
jgi:hypothetical protein